MKNTWKEKTEKLAKQGIETFEFEMFEPETFEPETFEFEKVDYVKD